MRTPRHIHERFLHFIWQNKYLALDELKSLDGQRIEIINIGVPNRDAGPDFRGAKMRIGRTLYQGDVEIHHDLTDWQKHFHSKDPKYNRVILHVVLRWHPRKAVVPPPKTQSGRDIPTLVLEPFLTEPLPLVWQRAILDERRDRIQAIRCYGKNDEVPLQLIRSWIEKLAVERMELKIRRFDERLRELVDERRLVVKEPYPRYYDDPAEIPPPTKEYTQKDFSKKAFWEQLLYEGTMEGLGYSKNQEPFLRLARNISLEFIHQELARDGEDPVLNLQAMLFGSAGFLSSSKSYDDAETQKYFNSLRKAWRKKRKQYRREVLHEADWQFFRLRPQNFPTVRLAAMSFLLDQLLRKDWMREIIQTFKFGGKPEDKLSALRLLLSVDAAGYWIEHFTFGGQAHRPMRRLIGLDRVQDIILNTVIPVALLYARIFKDSPVRREALKLYQNLPSAEQNSILKSMRSQLLKGRPSITSAYLQQGAIQLYKFYCVDERCGECEIGKIVFGSPESTKNWSNVISQRVSFSWE
ncbi:MAG: DUF2851 family protein [Bacteroidota bacterium]